MSELGARPGETMRVYVARITTCPRCHALAGFPCVTPSGRNHSERIAAAIETELEMYKALLAATRPAPTEE